MKKIKLSLIKTIISLKNKKLINFIWNNYFKFNF